jgi:hypothetical protein
MWKTKYKFRSEKGEFEAYCNPMHLRQAAACALAEKEAQFMEVADAKTGETLMIAVFREGNPKGFMFLFPDDENER